MNDEDLSKAVAFTLSNEINYERLITDLAQSHPAHFAELLKDDALRLASIFMKLDPKVYLEVAEKQAAKAVKYGAICDELRASNWIAAIKLLREGTGMGLKESKDIIVHARNRLITQGLLQQLALPPGSSMSNASPLSQRDEELCQTILMHF